jgi:hypothetical protein
MPYRHSDASLWFQYIYRASPRNYFEGTNNFLKINEYWYASS